MTTLETCHEPGVLLVLSRTTSPEYQPEVHNWYDTEHGPARLRLGKKYFLNGYRYKSLEDDRWLAIYDMNDLTAGSDKAYTSLRENRSRREQDVLDHKSHALSRQFLRLLTKPDATSAPAKAICLMRLNIQTGLQNARNTNQLSESLSRYGCRRIRMFDIVDGTDIELQKTLLTITCDFERDLDAEDMKRIKDTIIQCTPGSTSVTADFFSFYRAFSADEYIPPPETTTRPATITHELNGLRERL